MILVLLLACSEPFGAAQGDGSLADWGGPPGAFLELGPSADPQATPLLLEISEDSWELRFGATWRTAQELALLPVNVAQDGYRVDGTVVLPERMEPGESAGGTSVVADGEHEVWYGTFPDTRTVQIGDGAFRGRAVFAPGVGPIRLTFDSDEWELVTYD